MQAFAATCERPSFSPAFQRRAHAARWTPQAEKGNYCGHLQLATHGIILSSRQYADGCVLLSFLVRMTQTHARDR